MNQSRPITPDLLALAELHLQRIPCIYSRGRRMSAWTDVKEILFPSCSDKQCVIVLDVLKHFLNFPASEVDLRPCTPREHLSFLRQFRVVPAGTLLVYVDVLLKNLKSLWKSVSLKHSQTQNPNSKRCLYASGNPKKWTWADKIHLTTEDETKDGNVSLTFYRFPNPKLKSQSSGYDNAHAEHMTIPAIKCKDNVSGDGSSKVFIPTSCLSQCLPDLKEKLLDVCGNHLIYGPETSKHVLTKCCTDQEGRALTRWFHKVCGWGGTWQHLTSRDLLISWQEFLKEVGHGENIPGDEVEDDATESVDDEIKVKNIIGKVSEIQVSKSSSGSDRNTQSSVSDSQNTIENDETKDNNCINPSTTRMPVKIKVSPPFRQPKKRQRIISQKETSDVKGEIKGRSIEKNNSAIPKASSSGSQPIISTSSKPCKPLFSYPGQRQTCPTSAARIKFPSSNAQIRPTGSNAELPQLLQRQVLQKPVPFRFMVPIFNRPLLNPSSYMGNAIALTSRRQVQDHSSLFQQRFPEPCHNRSQYNSKNVTSSSSASSTTALHEESESKANQKNSSDAKQRQEVKVINEHDIVGNILKIAEDNEQHFQKCASIPSRDPRLKAASGRVTDSLSNPFDARKMPSEILLSKKYWKKNGWKASKEKDIMAMVTASPFTQSVESLKATRTLDMNLVSIENKSSIEGNSSRKCYINNAKKDDKVSVKNECNIQIQGRPVTLAKSSSSEKPSNERRGSKSETDVNSRWCKELNPKKSSSESAVQWKVRCDNLKLTFTKLLSGIDTLKTDKQRSQEDEKAKKTKACFKIDSNENANSKLEDENSTKEVEEIISALQRNPYKPKEKPLTDESTVQSITKAHEENSNKNSKLKKKENTNAAGKNKSKSKQTKNTGKAKPVDSSLSKGNRRDSDIGDCYVLLRKTEAKENKIAKQEETISVPGNNENNSLLEIAKHDSSVTSIGAERYSTSIIKRESAENMGDTTSMTKASKIATESEILPETINSSTREIVTTGECSKKEDRTLTVKCELQQVTELMSDSTIVKTSKQSCDLSTGSIKSGTEGITTEEVTKEEIKNIKLDAGEKIRHDCSEIKSLLCYEKKTHPKKKWMKEYLNKENCSYVDVRNLNVVFEDPLWSDEEGESDNYMRTSGEIIKEQDIYFSYKKEETADSDRTTKYEEEGSNDGLNVVNENSCCTEDHVKTADNDKQTAPKKKKSINENEKCTKRKSKKYKKKRKSLAKRKITSDASTSSTSCESNAHTLVKENSCQLILREVHSTKEIENGTKGKNKHFKKKRKSSVKCKMNTKVTATPSSNDSYVNTTLKEDSDQFILREDEIRVGHEEEIRETIIDEVEDDVNTRNRSFESESDWCQEEEYISSSNEDMKDTEKKASTSFFVRRSTRYCKSPRSYAESSPDSEKGSHSMIQSETEMTEREEEREKITAKEKPKRGRKPKALKKIEEKSEDDKDDKRAIEPPSKLYHTKKRHMHQFIKEQEMILSIIKNKGNRHINKTSSSPFKEGQTGKTINTFKGLQIIHETAPELTREEIPNAVVGESETITEKKEMPKLEPEGNVYPRSTKSNKLVSKKSARNTIISNPSQREETKETNEVLLPDLKRGFLVSGCSEQGKRSLQEMKNTGKSLGADQTNQVNVQEIRYEEIFDEVGKSNGGFIYHPKFVIPYVLMNGYKCVTVTDAVSVFTFCKSKCHIPRSTLQKHRSLFRTFSTWEQVYTLDLIYTRRGRSVKTGDMLIRWDSLMTNYQEILESVKTQHLSSKKNKYRRERHMSAEAELLAQLKEERSLWKDRYKTELYFSDICS